MTLLDPRSRRPQSGSPPNDDEGGQRESNRMPVEAAFVAIAINLEIVLAATICLAAIGNRSGERIVRAHSEPAFTAKENLSWTPAPLLS